MKPCPHCGKYLSDKAIRCFYCRKRLLGEPRRPLLEILNTRASALFSKINSWLLNSAAFEKTPSWGVPEVAVLWGLAYWGIWSLEHYEIAFKAVGFLRNNFFVFTHEPLLQSYCYMGIETFILKLGVMGAVAAILFLRKEKFSLALALKVHNSPNSRKYFSVFFFILVFIAYFEGLDPLFPYFPTNLLFRESAWLGNSVVLFSILAVAPVTEEIFFRGFMYPVFQRRMGAIAAVLTTSFLFALVHWPQLQGNFYIFGIIFLVGFLITLLRAFTGSTGWAILLHVAYNGLLTLAGYLKYFFEVGIFLFVFFMVSSNTPAWAVDVTGPEEAIRLGDDALFFKEYEKSADYYEFAAEEKPGEAKAHVRLALLHYSMGRYRDSKRQFEEARRLKKEPGDKQFIEAALEILEANSEILKQIEATPVEAKNLETLVELHKKAAYSITSSQKTYMNLIGPHYEFILERSSPDPKILLFLADGYYSSHDLRKSALYYKKLLLFEPRSVELNRRLGDVLLLLGDYTEVKHRYEKVLIETRRRRLSYTADTRELRDLIRSIPGNEPQIYEWISSQDWHRALRILKKTLSFNASDVWAMTQMARVYEGMGKLRDAEGIYKQVLKTRPEYAPAHYYWGNFLLLKKKKYSAAVEQYRLFQAYLGETLHRIEDPEKQKRAKKEWVEASRQVAYIYLEIMKKPNAAVAELEGLKPGELKDVEVYYDLGLVYLRVKKRIQAFQAFKKVIELKPDSEIAKDAKNAIEYLQKFPDYGSYTGPYD